MLPFPLSSIGQYLRRQTLELSSKISVQLSPVFTSRKLNDDLKPLKQKSALLNKQKVVYHFQGDKCECYVRCTSRHLHQRVDEHWGKTTIVEHTRKPGSDISSLPRLFSILRKSKNKWGWLVFEMLQPLTTQRLPTILNWKIFRSLLKHKLAGTV